MFISGSSKKKMSSNLDQLLTQFRSLKYNDEKTKVWDTMKLWSYLIDKLVFKYFFFYLDHLSMDWPRDAFEARGCHVLHKRQEVQDLCGA